MSCIDDAQILYPYMTFLEKARGMVSEERRIHSIGVAATALELAERFGVASSTAYVAGILHDVAREMSDGSLIELLREEGIQPAEWQLERPVLSHGIAGACILRRWGLEEPQILQAVSDHVTGRPGMGVLSKIVYVSDYIEPSRGFISVEFRSAIRRMGLNRMTRAVLEAVFAHLRGRNIDIVEPALSLYSELQGEEGEAFEET